MNLKLFGVAKTLAALRDAKNEITAEVDGEFTASLNRMVRNAKRSAPNNFGQLANSISFEKVDVLLYNFFADAYHAPYIEFGTRKKVQVPAELKEVAAEIKTRKGRGSYDDLLANILLWVKKKKIGGTQIKQVKRGKRAGRFRKAGKNAQDAADKNLAYLIAQKIMKDGISPQPFMYPAMIAERGKLVQNVRRVLNKKRKI